MYIYLFVVFFNYILIIFETILFYHFYIGFIIFIIKYRHFQVNYRIITAYRIINVFVSDFVWKIYLFFDEYLFI